MNLPSKPLLKSHDAARLLGISRSSLLTYLKQGQLTAERTLGGHYLFSLDELDRFAALRGITQDPALRAQFVEDSGIRRILIIEDDPVFREFCREALGIFENIRIAEAVDGIQGALLAGTFHAHLILLDIRMPNINGLEFLRMLRRNPATQDIPVLVLSAQLSEPIRAELQELGVSGALEKPIRLGELIAYVEKLARLN